MPEPKKPQATEFKPPSKKTIIIMIAMVVLFFLASSMRSVATFFTDWLLFDSLKQGPTFSTLITSQLFIPSIAFVLMLVSIIVTINLATHYGKKNSFMKDFDEWVVPFAQGYRKKPKVFLAFASVLVSVFFAASTVGYYKEWILFTNSQSVGIKDPLFNKDVGFFLFDLPFLRLLAGWVFGGLVLLLIVTAIAHYLNGSIALDRTRRHISTSAKVHLSILCALAGLAKAAQYYVERFALVHSTRGAVDGAAFTDVMARLPANRFLIFVAVIASILFLVNVYRKGVVLPLVAIALWMIVVLIVGTIYPLLIQNFSVNPSRNTKERPYAERNIEATRAAYDLDRTERFEIDFEQGVTQENVGAIKEALKDPLLWDEGSLAPWVQQKRGEQTYEFTTADRDRYKVGDRTLPVFAASREVVPPSQLPDRSWPSRHAVYTHGFGAAIASGSQVISGNEPDYLVSELPTEGQENPIDNLRLDTNRARNYFGEGLEEYVFVGSSQQEQTPLDEDVDLTELGGVGVGNIFNKAAFALRYWDYNVLITDTIQSDSKIIYERDPGARVKKIAPFLDVDSNPYPVITNGEVIWVVDAYTSSDQYPYSQYLDTDRLSPGNSLSKRLNYVRNSVKATVSARTGEVTLYIVDETDPLIKAYSQAFPDLFTDGEEAPQDIVDHYRYPEDIFDVQTFMYSDYHVEDPRVLLEGSSRLQVAPSMAQDLSGTNTLVPTTVQGGRADRTTQSSGIPLTPLYQYVSHSQMEEPEFLLTRSFVPISTTFRMDSFFSVSSDGDNYGKMRVLNFNIDGDDSALSPTMVQSQIDAESEFAQQRTLLGQQGSTVLYGEMQIVPVDNTVVYVQPIYVRGESSDARPVLTFVTVSVSGRTVCAPTIDQAVDALLAGTSICVPFTQNVLPTAGSVSTPVPPVSIPTPEDPAPTTTTTTPSGQTGLAALSDTELIERLSQASNRYQAAKNPLDLGALQRAGDEMIELVDELNRRNT